MITQYVALHPSAISNRPLNKRLLTLCLTVVFSSITSADPILVPRYDDADDILPAAEKKNTNAIRLFLRQQDGEEIFHVLTPRNVTVDVVSKVPTDSEFGVVLLLGGTGVLSIKDGQLDRSFSFQSRSRDQWWRNKIATFLIDAPSDRLDKNGIENALWRAGPQHQIDLRAVLDDISSKFKGPLVIHGHSNGALSTANVATINHPAVKAYVYSSGSHFKRPTTIVYESIHSRPVIFVQHKSDTCNTSSTTAFDEVVKKVKAPTKYSLLLDGGVTPISGPCGSFAPHSFFGMEGAVIDQQIPLIRKAISE